MAKNLTINGRSAVHQDSKGIASSISVNWTRIGKHTVPIPYPVVSKSEDCDKTATSVSVNGNPLCHQDSIFTRCKGDEPGKKKGIISGTRGGESFFLTGSGNVSIEGKPAVRAFDTMTLNNRNTPPTPLVQGDNSLGLAKSPTVPPSLTPPEQGHEIGFRPFGEFYDSVVLQNAADNTLQFLANAIHIEKEPDQGMPTSTRTTDNLDAGDYISWICSFDDSGASQYNTKHCESLPILETKSGWIMTPIPALLSANPTADNAQPGVDLVPIVPAGVSVNNTIAPFNNGWLYIFVNGYLWRELQVLPATEQAASFKDVNLITEQGKDDRAATGKAQDNVIWLPKQINGNSIDLRMAHSNEQWSWDTIRRLGGLDPENDPRYMADVHDATPLEDAPANTPDFLIPNPERRLTPVDLSAYDASNAINLPAEIDPESIETPAPLAFPTLVPLEHSGMGSDIFADADRMAKNPQLPVVVLPNPLQMALELAAQYQTAWGLFNLNMAHFSDPASVAALLEEGLELDEQTQDNMTNEVYRFQSARLLHQLFIQQPEALAKPTGSAEQDAENQALLTKLERWKRGLSRNHIEKLESSLKKQEISELKTNVLRCRERLVTFINDNQAHIEVFFLDMAARQDPRGYQTRYETANLLLGQLKDTVQSWERSVFGDNQPLTGEVDENSEGIALYQQLLTGETVFSHSLTLHAQEGSNNTRTHTGKETNLPDGIGGYDGNRVRLWATTLQTSALASAQFWQAAVKAMNSFMVDGAKFFAPQSEAEQRQQTQAQLADINQKADEIKQLHQVLGAELVTKLTNHPHLDQLRQNAQQAIEASLQQISDLEQQGNSLALAVANAKRLRADARTQYAQYTEQVQHQQQITNEAKLRLSAASHALSDANRSFNEAFAQLEQAQQALSTERDTLLAQQRQAETEITRAQSELDAVKQDIASQKRELSRLQKAQPTDPLAFTNQVQQQQVQHNITWLTQTDLRVAKQNLTDAQLKLKKIQSQLKLNAQQFALHGLQTDGQPKPNHGVATHTKPANQVNHLHFRFARTSAVMGSPIISLEAFAFEMTSANTRPGTNQLLASAHAAQLTEQGILPKLASMPRLDQQLNDVAALLYMYDSENQLLSHLKADLKQKFDTLLLLDHPTAEALNSAADMPSFNKLMAAHYDKISQYGQALERATNTLHQQMSTLSLDQRRQNVQQFHQMLEQTLTDEHAKLDKLTAAEQAHLDQWIRTHFVTTALEDIQDVTQQQRGQAKLDLQAAEAQLSSVEQAIGLRTLQADQQRLAQEHVQSNLIYLQRKGDTRIPYKARWQTLYQGNGVGLSFLMGLAAFQTVGLVESGKNLYNQLSFSNGIAVFGSITDTLAIFAQIVEKYRLVTRGDIHPALRTYAAKMARDAVRIGISTSAHSAIPAYLQSILHGDQAVAFNRLLIRTVLISSAANLFGSIGAGIGSFLNTAATWQQLRLGAHQAASGHALMALGSALQMSSSISAFRLGFMGANATRFILMTSSPAALILGVGLEVVGLMISLFSADGMTDFLSHTTWGKSPYPANDDNKKRWQTDAAAEWVALLNLFQSQPQAAASPGHLRCDQAKKQFQLMLPGFNQHSFASLSIEHRLASWQSPSAVHDRLEIRKQQLALYHSPGSNLGARLTQQLNQVTPVTSSQQNSQHLPYTITTAETEVGLLVTFQYNHWDLFAYAPPFTLHTVQLRIAYYQHGRNHTVGRHNTVFCNPVQPQQNAKSPVAETTLSLAPLITAVVTGHANQSNHEAERWVQHWQQQGQKYLTQHQQQEANNELSPWQVNTSGNLNGQVAHLLGQTAAYP